MSDIHEKPDLHTASSFERKDPGLVARSTQYLVHDVIADVAGAQFDNPNLDREHLGDIEDESPYPEVRSAVANTDDLDMPCRLIWAILLPGLNQFFYSRYPSVTIGNLVAQLLSYSMGRFLAWVLPKRRILGYTLNPGPFSIKEHVLITVMATVGATSAYASDIVNVQRAYYDQVWNFSYQWMMVVSTQLIGFSIVGIARRFLVAPPSMIWPANLVYCALFNTLHSNRVHWLPTRDSWWAEAKATGGFSFFFWFLTLSLYYTNTRYSQYMTISSRTSYDNQNLPYNVTRILTPESTLDLEAYKSYSPLFLSTTFALSYELSFASITATIVHAILYFRKQIWVQARRSLHEQPDLHARLMGRYKQLVLTWPLVSSLIFGIVCIEVWPTQMPIWVLFLALIIPFAYIIPIGKIQAITNQQVGLNVITKLISPRPPDCDDDVQDVGFWSSGAHVGRNIHSAESWPSLFGYWI
ncbi:hypothetical protein FRC06_007884 [Ceratobasidium sp. 370]|nr:hypothetical protein FRC06_007884 [Ceratobasidium sp. 370]